MADQLSSSQATQDGRRCNVSPALAAGEQPRPYPDQAKPPATQSTAHTFKFALWQPRFTKEITSKDDFSRAEVTSLSKILIDLQDKKSILDIICNVKALKKIRREFQSLKKGGKTAARGSPGCPNRKRPAPSSSLPQNLDSERHRHPNHQGPGEHD